MENIPSLNVPQIDLVSYVAYALQYIAKHYQVIFPILNKILTFLVILSFPVIVILIVGIVVSIERIKAIRAKEEEMLTAKIEPAYTNDKADPALTNRWQHVQKLIGSENENDWRQAIIEADIMLELLLEKQGYQGNSIGEKLKRVERADFVTLDDAWEAHKVRNSIAHDGVQFAISHREAKRVIYLFKKVFEEFYYI